MCSGTMACDGACSSSSCSTTSRPPLISAKPSRAGCSDAASAPCASSAAPPGRTPPDPPRQRVIRMSDVAASLRSAPTPRIEYRPYKPDVPLPRDVLGAVAFRDRSPRQNDPRVVRVGLKPLIGADIIEIWHASGPVSIGFDGIVRYAADPDHMLGA